MAYKGLPNKKIRCVRTTMMARSTSSHARPDRLARTKMTIPFEFPCNARPVHRYGAWPAVAAALLKAEAGLRPNEILGMGNAAATFAQRQ